LAVPADVPEKLTVCAGGRFDELAEVRDEARSIPVACRPTRNVPVEQRFINPPEWQEFMMSKINGDKARFNRVRKQNAAKRKRNREMLEQLTSAKAGAAASVKETKVVSA
jgi:hypothetical protein